MVGQFIRFLFAILVPVSALALLKYQGLKIGFGWAFGIAIGLFVYHYLQAALCETARRYSSGPADRSWISWLISVGIVLVLAKG